MAVRLRLEWEGTLDPAHRDVVEQCLTALERILAPYGGHVRHAEEERVERRPFLGDTPFGVPLHRGSVETQFSVPPKGEGTPV